MLDKNGSAIYSSSGKFVVPLGVSSVRVLVVGGGAGGGSGHAGGGGSGYVQLEKMAVEQLERVPITVGRGGQGSLHRLSNNAQSGTAGEPSAFGHYLIANGGDAPTRTGRARLAALAAAGPLAITAQAEAVARTEALARVRGSLAAVGRAHMHTNSANLNSIRFLREAGELEV